MRDNLALDSVRWLSTFKYSIISLISRLWSLVNPVSVFQTSDKGIMWLADNSPRTCEVFWLITSHSLKRTQRSRHSGPVHTETFSCVFVLFTVLKGIENNQPITWNNTKTQKNVSVCPWARGLRYVTPRHQRITFDALQTYCK